MAYKNVNRRISILVKAGLIEEVPYTKRTLHGRVDHRLTMKGLEYLIPHFLAHPDEIKALVEYMDRFGQNKQVFAHKLINQMIPKVGSTNLYLETMVSKFFYEFAPMNTEQIERLQKSMDDLGKGLEKYSNRLLQIKQKITSPKSKSKDRITFTHVMTKHNDMNKSRQLYEEDGKLYYADTGELFTREMEENLAARKIAKLTQLDEDMTHKPRNPRRRNTN